MGDKSERYNVVFKDNFDLRNVMMTDISYTDTAGRLKGPALKPYEYSYTPQPFPDI